MRPSANHEPTTATPPLKAAARAQLLNEKEAAEFLRVHRSTLYRWGRKGLVRPLRFGGVTRYRLEDLERFVDGDGAEG